MRIAWVKKNPAFNIDFMTATAQVVKFWNIDAASTSGQYKIPQQWKDWLAIGYDVLEDQRLLVLGCKDSNNGPGNMLLTYHLDTGESKEVRKDRSEPQWTSITCLPGNPLTAVAVECTDTHTNMCRLFDVNSGREFSKWEMPGWSRHVRGDPHNPNLVYVANSSGKIVLYDKSVKNEVRSFASTSCEGELQVPAEPGNLLIANDNSAAKIWDVGTGKLMHEIPVQGGNCRANLYGNVVATIGRDVVKVWDLLENPTEPVRELPQKRSNLMSEIYVTPHRILVIAEHLWITNPHVCTGGRYG